MQKYSMIILYLYEYCCIMEMLISNLLVAVDVGYNRSRVTN